jgi:hypothetical protein
MKKAMLVGLGAILLCAGCVSGGGGGTEENGEQEEATASVPQAQCRRVCDTRCVTDRFGRRDCNRRCRSVCR